MMEWDELLNHNIENNYNGQILTDVKCPKCGRNIYYDSTIIMMSYPEKYKYWCACGWTDCAPTEWVKGMRGTETNAEIH